MKRQPGPDLFSDPADPDNRAGLAPKDLLAGWRQPPLNIVQAIVNAGADSEQAERPGVAQ